MFSFFLIRIRGVKLHNDDTSNYGINSQPDGAKRYLLVFNWAGLDDTTKRTLLRLTDQTLQIK